MTSARPSQLRNAPWNSDDHEVLRQKWRLADESASNWEKFLQTTEILRIRVDHVEKGTSEYDELRAEAVKAILNAGIMISETGLTQADWDWFARNIIPDEADQLQEIIKNLAEVDGIRDVFDWAKVFAKAFSKSKRKFADAIKLSLNAWEEADDSHASWYQRVDDGVRIHGKLVKVSQMEAEVLLFLCKRTNRYSTYQELADLHETWRKGMDSGNSGSIRSQKSSMRTSLNKIRKAIRAAFKLSKDIDPFLRSKSSPGWKLDKDFLQTILQ